MGMPRIHLEVCMSRTRHHRTQKSARAGEDFWSRRGDMGTGAGTGPVAKHITHDRERRIEKEELINELKYLGGEINENF